MSAEQKPTPERPLELFDYKIPPMTPQILYPSDMHPGGLSGGAFYGVTMGPLGLTPAGLKALEQHEAHKASCLLGLELGPPVTLEQAKALHVQKVLGVYGWHLSKTAAALDISRQTLARSILRWGLTEPDAPAPAEPLEVPATFSDVTQLHVKQVLDELAWNITEAARALGIHRRTLYRLLDKWNVERPAVTS